MENSRPMTINPYHILYAIALSKKLADVIIDKKKCYWSSSKVFKSRGEEIGSNINTLI